MKIVANNSKPLTAKRRILPALVSAATLVAGQAYAQQAADSGQIQTIVVTATKRAEPLQSVPIAISVISGDLLEQTNLNTLVTHSNYPANPVSQQWLYSMEVPYRWGTNSGSVIEGWFKPPRKRLTAPSLNLCKMTPADLQVQ